MENSLSPEELLKLFQNRRSVRRYKPDPVPDAILQQILEAGRWAPSASNRQPWEFIIIRDKGFRKLISQYAAYYFVRWAHIEEAPVIIAICGDISNRIYRQFLHEDIGLAGGQMLLQATAHGLGTCWVGGFDKTAIMRILRIPATHEPIALITMGYPDEEPAAPERKSLEKLVHYDTYGNLKPGETAPEMKPGALDMFTRKLRRRTRL